MPRWRRPTAASGRSPGTRCSPARRVKQRFDTWLPDETVEAYRKYLVGIKGPLTTPVGKGIRSLNVALRQLLDLYVCLRPVRWFTNVPSPVKRPGDVDMVIFRENTEDIYAGVEWEAESAEAQEGHRVSAERDGGEEDPLPRNVAASASSRSRARAPSGWCARRSSTRSKNKRKSVTLVHKGNIMKFTEGAFRDWGYALATREFRDEVVTERETLDPRQRGGEPEAHASRRTRKQIEPGYDMAPPEAQAELRAEVEAALQLVPTHGDGKWKKLLKIRDSIADITLQQVLTRPKEFDVIATLNLNGDYLTDALAAQVGGIGIAPGGNINYDTGHAIFEATHGTAPKYANLDKVNPGSVILSGEMMLRHLGWNEAADSDHQGHGRRDRRQDRDLRLRAADGRRERSEVLGVRARDHRAHALRTRRPDPVANDCNDTRQRWQRRKLV